MNDYLEAHLSSDVARLLLEVAQRRKLVKGEELVGPGMRPDAMFGVISGLVCVSATGKSGRRFLAARMGPGLWFGEVPLLDNGVFVYGVHAEEESQVAVLSSAKLWTLIERHPFVLLAFTRLTCARYRMTLDWIEQASLKPFAARLADCLVRPAFTMGGLGDDTLAMSQEDLASFLGVSRQTVNRQLKVWERQGIVSLRYGAVCLLNRLTLREFADSW